MTCFYSMLKQLGQFAALGLACCFMSVLWLERVCSQELSTVVDSTPQSEEFFEREVRPILLEHCSSCHSRAFGKVKGGLSLDSRDEALAGGESGAAIVPGSADESLMIEAIRRQSFEMPPEKPLPDQARAILERWVVMGAPWSQHAGGSTADANWLQQRAADHWAWRPLPVAGSDAIQPPSLEHDDWSRRPLDRFIAQRLRGQGLQPSPPADGYSLLRRLCFDLTGLPPSQAQLLEFNDLSDARQRERLIEQLLASPQFGVRWGRHWLDLVRYSETMGHEFDFPIRDAWRYRDSLTDALNIDVPYSQLVCEHLAGDLITEPRRHPRSGIDQSLAATGWWWLGESLHAPVDVQADWALRIDNQIDVLSKTFLGMTVACARCHDHKFDAIGVEDYYGLSGMIQSSRREYALTDPSGEIQQHQQRLSTLMATADSAAGQLVLRPSAEQISAWLDSTLQAIQQLGPAKQAAFPQSSPLAVLELLLPNQHVEGQQPASAGRDPRAWRERLLRSQADFDAWQNESELFADLSQGLPQGWRVNGVGHPQSPSAWDWFSRDLPLPSRMDVFSSKRLGPKQSLTLTSPDFEVTRTHICLKMRGADSHATVVVSNYFMQEFHGLLFKDLRKEVQQPLEEGWLTHAGDLNKYLGQPAYLMFEDRGPAWFEVQQVRFADRPPPEVAHPWVIDVLRQTEDSPENLKPAVLAAMAQGLAADAPCDSDARDVARVLVEHGLSLGVVHPIEMPTASADTASKVSAVREHAARLREFEQSAPAPTILVATAEGTPHDVRVAVRGNPHELGELVARGCLAEIVPAVPAEADSSGRWQLAQSLVASQHPLTARVMVNRIWMHLMGQGLVSTPDNFGVLGGRPQHSQLLDYLAREFIQHDWSVKWLIREIALSQTYQLSSHSTEEQLKLDALGQSYSHRRLRRLSAEAAARRHVNGGRLPGPSIGRTQHSRVPG